MNQAEFKSFSAMFSDVADYYGKKMSLAAIQIYWNALAAFDLSQVKRLLDEHVKASKFMPTVSELLDVIKGMDGRPNAEEAWAMVAKCLSDEGPSVVWTDEMAAAFGVALGLSDDRIAARMAFKESYEAAVSAARKAGKPARWSPALGHDAHGRDHVLGEAVEKKRLTAQHAAGLLPHFDEPNPKVVSLFAPEAPKQIEDRASSMPRSVRDQLRAITSR